MVIVAGLCASGCVSLRKEPSATRNGRARVKSVLGVVAFENQAGFSGQWNLGQGMADMLVTELLDTGEVTVLERHQLGSVIDEIRRQGQALFRSEGRAESGRLKNAQFLVTGSVTDFTITNDASGWFSSPTTRARGRGTRAVVSLHMRVSDVETGEIVHAVKTQGNAYTRSAAAAVDYRTVSFGGDAFAQTPLGRATEAALRDAVREILRNLPERPFELAVAESSAQHVIVNGGTNAGLRAGDILQVRRPGRVITDPFTGDPLETYPGPVYGKLEVYQVNPLTAYAHLLEGNASRGDRVEFP